jgi:hypothetical protein
MNQHLLYLFNPDHDLALASNNANYMPPTSARRLCADVALLPIWYARSPDALVLASSAYNSAFLKEMQALFPQLPRLLTEPEVAVAMERLVPAPWGWDPSVHKKLLSLGMPVESLPAQKQLAAIRNKAHRSSAVKLLKDLQLDSNFCGESFFLTNADELCHFVESHDACLLKAPLSGSGKGLNWCKGAYTPHIHTWSECIIKQQGGVVAEPVYNKVIDFAMLFYADSNAKVSFTGYSLFRTNIGGAYEGNFLMMDEMIEKQLGGYVPLSSLHELRSRLEKELPALLQGVYTGYLGVDMMICRFADTPIHRIHPCVEINLRMSMGVVARLFYDRYIQPGITGEFRIHYFPSATHLKAKHIFLLKNHPLQMVDGKITSGYLPLIPVTPESRYAASVWL